MSQKKTTPSKTGVAKITLASALTLALSGNTTFISGMDEKTLGRAEDAQGTSPATGTIRPRVIKITENY